MGREVKRVTLDFNWPLHKTWTGFINPYYKHKINCVECDGGGDSKRAKELSDLWYGYDAFDPHSTGSEPFPYTHPVIWGRALRNAFFMLKPGDVTSDDYLINPTLEELAHIEKNRKWVVEHEAKRLADRCFNNCWHHHLSQEDVDILWEDGQLRHDFQEKPTAKEYNEHALSDSFSCGRSFFVIIESKCKKEGVPSQCPNCKGEGGLWDSPENEKKCEEWEREEPPSGVGYQIWETVSEGSPVSPVFAEPSDLAKWMVENDDSITKNTTYYQWLKFIKDCGWAPSMIGDSNGIKSGTEVIDTTEEIEEF